MSSLEYRDLTKMTDVSALGMIVCNSRGYPPTHIAWTRDNILLSLDDSNNSYEQIQQVVTRSTSVYSNILILKNVHGVVGNYTYGCSIRNQVGEVSRTIEVSNTGIGHFHYYLITFTASFLFLQLIQYWIS